MITIFRNFRMFFVLNFAFSFSNPSFSQPQCSALFSKNYHDKLVIALKLSDVPGLKNLVLRLIDDSSVPSHIQRVVKKALIQKDAAVSELTDSLKRELNLPPQVEGMHGGRKLKFFLVKSSGFSSSKVESDRIRIHEWMIKRFRAFLDLYSQFFGRSNKTKSPTMLATPGIVSLNTEIANRVSDIFPFVADQVVLVQDRPLSSEVNDFIVLFHELSHIRFDAFLERNLEQLVRRLPSNLIRRTSEGEVEIIAELYEFLSERYALEIELNVLFATLGRYYPERPLRYDEGVTPQNYKLACSHFVIRTYRITNPSIQRLANYSLSEILLGKSN